MADSGSNDLQAQNPRIAAITDRVLTVQRPVVLANIRGVRARNPGADPEQVIRILERQYLTAVTSSGAAVGAAAVIPAVGVAASFALSTVETVGFLEASALFAQSVTEVHGIAVTDPERARALVMTMMLGSAGTDLVKQLAGQVAGNGPARTTFWGELVTKSIPRTALGPLVDRLRGMFVKRFLTAGAGTFLGRAIPFGVGAVVGGAGNHILGRRIVAGARDAFGPAPQRFPAELDPKPRESRERRLGAETGQAHRPIRDRFRRRHQIDSWTDGADAAGGAAGDGAAPDDPDVEDPTPADVPREAAPPEHDRDGVPNRAGSQEPSGAA